MKKSLVALALISAVGTAAAQVPTATARPVHYYGGHGHGHYGWVAPLIVGGVAGYAVAQAQRPTTVIVQQPQQAYYVEQVQVAPQCGPWREQQHMDGTVTRERLCR